METGAAVQTVRLFKTGAICNTDDTEVVDSKVLPIFGCAVLPILVEVGTCVRAVFDHVVLYVAGL